jgi:hypothetical protein
MRWLDDLKYAVQVMLVSIDEMNMIRPTQKLTKRWLYKIMVSPDKAGFDEVNSKKNQIFVHEKY